PWLAASGRMLDAWVENRRISIANDPSRPIQTMPRVVIEMLGIGPASTLRAPTKLPAVAMNPNAIASGIVPSPNQYAATGAATHVTMPVTAAGRYPFSATLS